MAEAAKIRRRTAKAKLTRHRKALRKELGDIRQKKEITEALQLVKDAYRELITKHDANAEQIEDDEAFEQEELWLEESQNAYLELETNALDYIKLNVEAGGGRRN